MAAQKRWEALILSSLDEQKRLRVQQRVHHVLRPRELASGPDGFSSLAGSLGRCGIKEGRGDALAFLGDAVPVQAQRALFGSCGS